MGRHCLLQYIAKHNAMELMSSPGTHAIVFALMGLEEPPTAFGVPLSSMAKFSPLSVLVKLQESLHNGNSTPARGFFIMAPHNSQQVLEPPLQGGDFFVCVPFTAHLHGFKCFYTARESEVSSTS